jgi:hypothetical protein
MCVTLGVGMAIASIAVSVVGAVTSAVMQADAASKQNEANKKKQEAIRQEEVRQMQMLAVQEQEYAAQQSQQADDLQRQEAIAAAQGRQASADAGVKGESTSRLLRDLRRQRLEGVQAAETNYANFRAQQMMEARGIRATSESRNNSLQWANPTQSIVGGVLGAAGAVAGGMGMDVGGGDTLAGAIGNSWGGTKAPTGSLKLTGAGNASDLTKYGRMA